MFSTSLIQRLKNPTGDSPTLRGLAGEAERAYETVANVDVRSTGANIEPGQQAATIDSLKKWLKQIGLEFETYNSAIMRQAFNEAYNLISQLRSTVTQAIVDAEKAKQYEDQASGHVPTDIGSIIPGTPLWAQAILAKLDQLLSR